MRRGVTTGAASRRRFRDDDALCPGEEGNDAAADEESVFGNTATLDGVADDLVADDDGDGEDRGVDPDRLDARPLCGASCSGIV